MPPFLTGGSMILNVRRTVPAGRAAPTSSRPAPPPSPSVGFGAAVDYLEGLGMDHILAHEQALTACALRSG